MAQNFRRSVAQHREEIVRIFASVLERRSGRPAELVSVYDAAARLTAEATVARNSLPAFDNSQMDGYAVRVDDFPESPAESASATFRLAPVIPAGTHPAALAPGFAAPIMTGAMLPEGATAIIPIEAVISAVGTEPHSFPDFSNDDYLEIVTVTLPRPPRGQFIRSAGSDVAAGTVVIEAGTVLTPRHVGLLAALGIAEIAVQPRTEVLVLSTGDEVQAPGETLKPGHIYDSNSAFLSAALHEIGLTPVRVSISSDTVAEFERRLEEALAAHPNALAALTTGGISKGAFEVVKVALERRGIEFGSVAMQPGGPQGCGILEPSAGHSGDHFADHSLDPLAVISFPGNPVSTAISFEIFVRPLLAAIARGETSLSDALQRAHHQAILHLDSAELTISSPAAKSQWRRGVVSTDPASGERLVRLIGTEQSHLVFALAQANALVNIPEGTAEARHGDTLTVMMLEEG